MTGITDLLLAIALISFSSICVCCSCLVLWRLKSRGSSRRKKSKKKVGTPTAQTINQSPRLAESKDELNIQRNSSRHIEDIEEEVNESTSLLRVDQRQPFVEYKDDALEDSQSTQSILEDPQVRAFSAMMLKGVTLNLYMPNRIKVIEMVLKKDELCWNSKKLFPRKRYKLKLVDIEKIIPQVIDSKYRNIPNMKVANSFSLRVAGTSIDLETSSPEERDKFCSCLTQLVDYYKQKLDHDAPV
jgi:hypothetical protein